MKTLYHFGVSGGKDSTALLLWACYESGIPLEQIRATMCNTGNESPITLAYVQMLSTFVHPIEILEPPLDFYALAAHNKRFPSAVVRFCTRELKMKPTQAWIKQRWDEGHEVVLHSGVRASESFERSKLAEEEFDGYYACIVKRPLLRWSLADVWAILDRYSVPRNPLYDMGAQRVGCFPCVMSRKAEIRAIAYHFPERIDFLRGKEMEVGLTRNKNFSPIFQRNRVPLGQRSMEYTTAKGKKIRVASIDDVVRWSRTVRGGMQYALGTIDEDCFEREDDKTISCPSAIGQCE